MKTIYTIAALGATLALAACNPSGSGSKPAASAAASAGGPAGAAALASRIAQKGSITVGTEGTYAPFSFHDAAGKLTGYDVDVMNAVAKKLGVQVEYRETQWDAMFAGLNSQRFDLIANQVGVTPERQGKYLFSTPYTYSGEVVVVRGDDTRIHQWADVKGLKAAQSLTSNHGKMAAELGADVTAVDGLAQSAELLRQKRIDFTINDKLAVLDYLKANPTSGLKIALNDDKQVGTAFAFNQGNEEAVKQFDQALQGLRDDGTLAALGQKWFGTDVSRQ